jgi:hypothetical protein
VLRRWVSRIAATALYAGAAVAVYVIAVPLFSSGGGGADTPAAEAANRARPKSVPARVPQWAWDLTAWRAKPVATRGKRPASIPYHVPEWYWEWRDWRAGR